jgi:hypothetical protein
MRKIFYTAKIAQNFDGETRSMSGELEFGVPFALQLGGPKGHDFELSLRKLEVSPKGGERAGLGFYPEGWEVELFDSSHGSYAAVDLVEQQWVGLRRFGAYAHATAGAYAYPRSGERITLSIGTYATVEIRCE